MRRDDSARTTPVRVVDYRPEHRDHFRDLNLEWIGRYFEVEDEDRRVLGDPEREILAPGGAILMAVSGEDVLGTCALIRHGPDTLELAKMAVAERARGRGVGERLGRAAIERARALGARRLELVSNRRLAPALALYRKLGFVEAPLGEVEYRR
ncbi:MAG TPA: GNAT family N-acetyltransferase, partial [Gemmatimonadales bacterium]|nr:GNAT family N-acetyltransferase [Gemmatimonadales bacterium]